MPSDCERRCWFCIGAAARRTAGLPANVAGRTPDWRRAAPGEPSAQRMGSADDDCQANWRRNCERKFSRRRQRQQLTLEWRPMSHRQSGSISDSDLEQTVWVDRGPGVGSREWRCGTAARPRLDCGSDCALETADSRLRTRDSAPDAPHQTIHQTIQPDTRLATAAAVTWLTKLIEASAGAPCVGLCVCVRAPGRSGVRICACASAGTAQGRSQG